MIFSNSVQKLAISILSLLAFPLSVTGQNVAGTISGQDGNGNTPLAGAYIIWAGTSHGTISDMNGHFDLQPVTNDGHQLVFSYVGYVSDTLLVAPGTTIDIVLRPITMQEVNVSARRVGTSIDRMSTLTRVNISADELCKAACCNLGESFETNASVDVNYADAATGAKTIQMLGLQGRYVQMMTENVPSLRGIASPFGLSYVPGPWMNGIQMSKGVGTVVNGAEAITGQINIDFRKAVGTEEVTSLNLFGSSSGRIEANASVNAKLGPKFRTNIMANVSNDLMDMDENSDGFRDEPKVKQMNLFWRLYRHNDVHTWDFVIKTLNEQRIGGSCNFNSTHPVENVYGVYINTDRLEGWMKNGFVLSDEFNIGFPIGYTYHHQSSFFGERKYVGTEHSYNFNSIANLQLGELHELHFGLSSQGDFYKENVDCGTGLRLFNRSEIVFGAYGQYTLSIEHSLSLVAGIRVDRHNHYGVYVSPRLHVRWEPVENTIIRVAAGKGYRSASIFAENNFLFTSKREWVIPDTPYGQEAGWNMGINFTQYVTLFDGPLTINAEYYRTEFQKQMVTDMDYSIRELHAYFSKKRSYANNIQIEAKYTPVRGLDVTAAWRWNENILTLGGERRTRPLTSRYKGLVALSYQTPLKTWQIDANIQLNGGGRIPTTVGNPLEYTRYTRFNAYQMYNAQITKWFRKWSVYAGCENIGNFMQKDPIIASEEPNSNYFDSSLIWGPLMSRKFYIGFRWHLDKYDDDDN